MSTTQTENYSHSFSFSLNGVTVGIHNNSKLFSFNEPHYCSEHRHHVTEIHYVYAGSEIVTILNKKEKREERYCVEAGQLLIIFPQTYHATNENSAFSRLTFTVEAIEEVPSVFSKKVTDALNAGKDTCTIIEDKYLSNTFEGIQNAFRQLDDDNIYFNNYNRQLLMTSAVTHILDILLKNQFPAQTRTPPMTDLHREYLIKNFFCMATDQGHTLDSLAKMIHLSPRQTQTTVERIMGKNFKTLVLEQRMSTAELLITCTDKSLAEICESSGYSSYSSFYTAFVNYYGITPTEYKRLHGKSSS